MHLFHQDLSIDIKFEYFGLGIIFDLKTLNCNSFSLLLRCVTMSMVLARKPPSLYYVTQYVRVLPITPHFPPYIHLYVQ